MHHDVVVVGSINTDLVLTVPRHPRPGETLIGQSRNLSAGGKGANQAVAAARLGASTAMVGAVGDDAEARTALHELSAAGTDLRAVITVPGPTGLAVVTVSEDGENTIVVVPGANAAVTVPTVEGAAATIRAARVCVLQAEIPLPSVERAVAVAAEAGVRVVLNVAPACDLPMTTLRHADPVVVNEQELSLVLGWLEGDGAPAGPSDGPDAAARATVGAERLRAAGVPSVVVTLGAAGVVGAERGGTWREPARRVTAQDTTGAGDAFVGALAAQLARGSTLREAARLATRVAAFSVQRSGAQPSYPWQDDELP